MRRLSFAAKRSSRLDCGKRKDDLADAVQLYRICGVLAACVLLVLALSSEFQASKRPFACCVLCFLWLVGLAFSVLDSGLLFG